eukprot:9504015-Pyramimonas_sp.AAC.4
MDGTNRCLQSSSDGGHEGSVSFAGKQVLGSNVYVVKGGQDNPRIVRRTGEAGRTTLGSFGGQERRAGQPSD